jgi:glycerol uptake facilitator-like aquaporin
MMKRNSALPAPELSPAESSQIVDAAKELEEKRLNEAAALDQVISNQVLKDNSLEAKRGRQLMVIRAAYGEFMATFLFLCPIYCVLAHGKDAGWGSEMITLAAAFVTGFQGIGLAFAFSGISGAILNPAVAFALWLTGKLSNRRCAYYILVEILASIVAMIVVSCMFSGEMGEIYNSIAVVPAEGANLGKVFASEFFLTFFLTYTAFTVAFEDAEAQKKESMSIKKISDAKGLTLYATTPQSKTGFAPFSIGFILFSISLIGGTSGGAFNPARMFGPALFSGKWRYLYLYWIAQFVGAGTAGLLVNNLHQFGLRTAANERSEVQAVVAKSIPMTELELGASKSTNNPVHS